MLDIFVCVWNSILFSFALSNLPSFLLFSIKLIDLAKIIVDLVKMNNTESLLICSCTEKDEVSILDVAKLIAKELGIPTYSFIDHYTSFLERFDLDGERIYPDFICLIDDIAKSILHQNKIDVPAMITGNYFHEYLRSWKPVYTKKEVLKKVGIQLSKKKLCLYLTDK